MKAKRLSRLTVEGLSDTGYVVGHESNIESEAANETNKKYARYSPDPAVRFLDHPIRPLESWLAGLDSFR